MFFKNKQLEKRVADLEEADSRLKIQQDAQWKVLNSLLDRIQSAPYGIKKNGEPRNKAGRPKKVVTV